MSTSQEKSKPNFANAWKKVADISKKAADGAKNLVDQTIDNIHEQRAKKYTAVSKEMFEGHDFQLPSVIRIEDENANREFIEDTDALGWIELHKEVPVFHIYWSCIKDCGYTFVPVPQKENVYCQDNFDTCKFINSNQVFGKATEEKLAELNGIAYSLGARSCSIEIIEEDTESQSQLIGMKKVGSSGVTSASSNKQSGKSTSSFEGHDNPEFPILKWFEHDDNIKNLISMRMSKAIKSNVLELKGSSSATMSKKVACAIDDIIGIGGNLSMERQAIKEHSNKLRFEIKF